MSAWKLGTYYFTDTSLLHGSWGGATVLRKFDVTTVDVLFYTRRRRLRKQAVICRLGNGRLGYRCLAG